MLILLRYYEFDRAEPRFGQTHYTDKRKKGKSIIARLLLDEHTKRSHKHHSEMKLSNVT